MSINIPVDYKKYDKWIIAFEFLQPSDYKIMLEQIKIPKHDHSEGRVATSIMKTTSGVYLTHYKAKSSLGSGGFTSIPGLGKFKTLRCPKFGTRLVAMNT